MESSAVWVRKGGEGAQREGGGALLLKLPVRHEGAVPAREELAPRVPRRRDVREGLTGPPLAGLALPCAARGGPVRPQDCILARGSRLHGLRTGLNQEPHARSSEQRRQVLRICPSRGGARSVGPGPGLAVRCLASPSLPLVFFVCVWFFFLNPKDVRRKEKGASIIIRKKQRFPKTQNEWGNERTGIRVVAKTEAYKCARRRLVIVIAEIPGSSPTPHDPVCVLKGDFCYPSLPTKNFSWAIFVLIMNPVFALSQSTARTTPEPTTFFLSLQHHVHVEVGRPGPRRWGDINLNLQTHQPMISRESDSSVLTTKCPTTTAIIINNNNNRVRQQRGAPTLCVQHEMAGKGKEERERERKRQSCRKKILEFVVSNGSTASVL